MGMHDSLREARDIWTTHICGSGPGAWGRTERFEAERRGEDVAERASDASSVSARGGTTPTQVRAARAPRRPGPGYGPR